MKILLLNDTRVEDNPGCHATVEELLKFIKVTIPDSSIDTVSFGAEYDRFSDERLYRSPGHMRRSIKFVRNFFSDILAQPTWYHNYPQIDEQFWKENFTRILSSQFKQKVSEFDLIIVNMEGTIHHNCVGGLALVSMALYCKQQGKLVFMVNGSYQSMSTVVSKSVLTCMDFVSVREPRSKAYLDQMDINAHLIPDFAFLSDLRPAQLNFDGNRNIEGPKCLYTPGVLGAFPRQKAGLSLKLIVQHIGEIRKAGYEPYFLKVEKRETQIEIELRKIKVKTLYAIVGAETWKLGEMLSNFDLILTGRYHIGIFAILSQTKTLFLPSNTFKIEGLLELINAQNMMIKHPLTAKKLKKHILKARCAPIKLDDIRDKYAPFARILKETLITDQRN